jgi:hypothetical protein
MGLWTMSPRISRMSRLLPRKERGLLWWQPCRSFRARGEYIALLNNDTAVVPEWLASLYTVMRQDPLIGICASCMINYYQRDRLIRPVTATISAGWDSNWGRGGRCLNSSRAEPFLVPAPVLPCIGDPCWMILVFSTGVFFAYGEDLDLSFRARLAGYTCRYVPKAVVYHKINQTVGTDSDFLLYHTRRNIEYTYCKNMPFALMIPHPAASSSLQCDHPGAGLSTATDQRLPESENRIFPASSRDFAGQKDGADASSYLTLILTEKLFH